MTTVSEKEILEIEMLKAKLSQVFHDTQIDLKRLEADQVRFDKNYEADRIRFDKNYEANQIRFDKKYEADQKRFDKKHDIELGKKSYEAWRLAFYGVAVGAGGTFAIAKTLQLLGAG